MKGFGESQEDWKYDGIGDVHLLDLGCMRRGRAFGQAEADSLRHLINATRMQWLTAQYAPARKEHALQQTVLLNATI